MRTQHSKGEYTLTHAQARCLHDLVWMCQGENLERVVASCASCNVVQELDLAKYVRTNLELRYANERYAEREVLGVVYSRIKNKEGK